MLPCSGHDVAPSRIIAGVGAQPRYRHAGHRADARRPAPTTAAESSARHRRGAARRLSGERDRARASTRTRARAQAPPRRSLGRGPAGDRRRARERLATAAASIRPRSARPRAPMSTSSARARDGAGGLRVRLWRRRGLNSNGPTATRPMSWRRMPALSSRCRDLLDSDHKVENAADAEAYLARLAPMPSSSTARPSGSTIAAAQGVIAPDFLLDKTLRADASRARAPIAPVGPGHLAARNAPRACPATSATPRRTAGDRQGRARARPPDRRAWTPARKRATSDAGVWKLPDGEAYYAWALKRRHDHDDDARTRSTQMGLEQLARAPGRDGRDPAKAGPHQGHASASG